MLAAVTLPVTVASAPALSPVAGRGSKIIALVAKNSPGKLLTEPDGVLRAEDETKAAYWTLDALVEAAREIGIEISRSQVRIPLPPGGGGFTELRRLLFPQLSAAHFRLSAGKPEFI